MAKCNFRSSGRTSVNANACAFLYNYKCQLGEPHYSGNNVKVSGNCSGENQTVYSKSEYSTFKISIVFVSGFPN